ncbi:gamma-glutamyltransferase 1 Threonine peptidase. MEROPS family T03 [Gemmobacter megaterium]|uniref:Gamma-glutamyltransferase 1 Threonine peptidase. MEROPS family T03 n=1 Tax=Gemmobacter megaterium TaxID=1086013 RepID=A0A1N7QQ73_9RHOB|nr:gamma-glutamyltransferase [Gemmobacter megaterium]GGE28713.1 gamma-glutamyltransferase [Gemmobacter megaterium]SIT25070.1 gamma-glutamyltransferase 1 Threonine peptidase. MEROPS family T03 [Gemmobacter megaterium]
MTNFSQTQHIRKEVVWTEGGVVAAQHRTAAEVGAKVLADGGDAMDAAVATSFALGVVEPWMSGPMGGGMMTLWRAGESRAETIEFGMRSPAGLDLADYPLERDHAAGDLFPWTRVAGDRNIYGATAVAVPGTVAGMELAHSRYGTRDWADLLAPAIALAERGMLIDWYASLLIASATRQLARDSDAARMFLIDGQWPNISGWTAATEARLDQSVMARSLRRLAEAGPRDFYEGELAAALVADMQAKGSALSLADLAGYRARASAPRSFRYRDAMIHAPSGLSAGDDLRATLEQMEQAFRPTEAPSGDSYAALAAALSAAYRHRLAHAGDTGGHDEAPACTTTFSIVDRAGNMVNVTQTLLSIFGSHIVSPTTGMLMNNGIMWFDPEPGRPNSLAPDKGCLMNICPTIGQQGDRMFAIGASGGRKILPAVANLTSFMVDFGMSLEAAFHHPRIDLSNPDLAIADETLPASVQQALAATLPMRTARRTVHPYAFGVPAGVMRQGGRNCGATEIMTPWGDAVSETEVSDKR